MSPAPDLLGQALQFRLANDQPTGAFCPMIAAKQMRLIQEEYFEFLESHTEAVNYIQNTRSKEAVLKELADLVYTCFQYAAAAGWELDEALDRVHKSNMSKLGPDGKPIKDSNGKVMKGPNYQPPYLVDII